MLIEKLGAELEPSCHIMAENTAAIKNAVINDAVIKDTVSVSKSFKRIADVIMAFSGMVFLLPFLVLIALVIKCTDPTKPVLFKQVRIGLNGRSFHIIKFRTMTCLETTGHIEQVCRGDNRVTYVGSFLRKTSIDELPQLWNVLNGTMSLVGPRPHAVMHDETYTKLVEGYRSRQDVLPGITGWAQINGHRGETNTLEKMQNRVQCDLWYISNYSLLLDLKIILKTVPALLRNRDVF